MANLIDAIITLVKNPIVGIGGQTAGNNRATNAGDALEEYIKDLFADAFVLNKQEKNEKYNSCFSWLGNKTNPPDCMLRGGDAIEIKKIESYSSTLALNSSYPKQKLFATSEMITKDCKNAENWDVKDMLYIVGHIFQERLRNLCIVYGVDYCASEETYRRIKRTIKAGIENIPNVEWSETNELGRLNRIDPLGITYLRIRGMWGIENPWKVFDYVYQQEKNKSFNFMCIINEEKWKSFTNTQSLIDIQDRIETLCIKDIKIKNPDNPAQLKKAKLISFTI